jgi:hypothetical protein
MNASTGRVKKHITNFDTLPMQRYEKSSNYASKKAAQKFFEQPFCCV